MPPEIGSCGHKTRRVRRGQSQGVALGEKRTTKENFRMKCGMLSDAKPPRSLL